VAQYHGDISQFEQPFFRSRSDKNLAVACILLFFLGFTGIHRFYLNQPRHGLVHLILCMFAVIFGIFTLNFWFAATIFGLQLIALTIELVLLVVQMINEA
jgi:TM2 domain-containing membrane protein YozV